LSGGLGGVVQLGLGGGGGGLGGASSGLGLGLGGSTLGRGNQLEAQQKHALMKQQLELLSSAPFGDSPLFRMGLQEGLRDRSGETATAVASEATRPAPLTHYKLSTRHLTPKFRPASAGAPSRTEKAKIFSGLEETQSQDFTPRHSVKKLILTPKSSRMQLIKKGTYESEADSTTMSPSNSPKKSPLKSRDDGEGTGGFTGKPLFSPSTPVATGERLRGLKPQNTSFESPELHVGRRYNNPVVKPTPRRIMPSGDGPPQDSPEQSTLEAEISPRKCGIILTREDYYTVPALDVLDDLCVEGEHLSVQDFVVGRKNYGKITFCGETCVKDLNLDELVSIEHMEVTVYPNDENKPPVGEELNKKALINLDRIWPTDKTTREPITDPDRLQLMKYTEKLERSTTKIGARFVDYLPETGSWKFEVDHFSKYRLVQDDESEEEGETKSGSVSKVKVKVTDQQASQTGRMATTSGVPQKRVPLPQGRSDSEVDEDTAVPMDEDETWKREERAPVPSEPQSVSSPPSYQMAQARGLSSQRIQVMKASFFHDQEGDQASQGEASAKSDQLSSQKAAIGTQPLRLLVSQPLAHNSPLRSLLHSKTAVPEKEGKLQEVSKGKEEKSREDVMDVKPSDGGEGMDVVSSSPEVTVELADTTLSAPKAPYVPTVQQNFLMPRSVNELCLPEKEEVRLDALQLLGRSFRVGWGHDWTIYHSGMPCGRNRDGGFSIFSATTSVADPDIPEGSLPYRVLSEKVSSHPIQMAHIPVGSVSLGYDPLLRIQLKHSSPVERGGGRGELPHYSTTQGTDALEDYASLPRDLWPTDRQTSTHFWQVWQLCKALWGNLPKDEESVVEEGGKYHKRMARRDIFTAWLADVISYDSEEEIAKKQTSGGAMDAVFALLLCGNVKEAVSICLKNKDYRLATLIAQGGWGNPSLMNHCREQLSEWETLKAYAHISDSYLKVYVLLAGLMVWRVPRKDIALCGGLEWKKSLALHLWYVCPPTASIEEAVETFQNGFMGCDDVEPYTCPPRPPYLQHDTSVKQQLPSSSDLPDDDDEDGKDSVYDTCFCLLQLYGEDVRGSLESLLSPQSSTNDPMDYRMSWHLYQVLQSLGLDTLSAVTAEELHLNYAAQLEQEGLWHWAVFVLLHLSDPLRRLKAIKDMLPRCCAHSENLSDEEKFVISQLGVNPGLLHEAKALYAHDRGDFEGEAEHLVKAHLWDQAHLVIMNELVPKAIMCRNTKHVRQLLSELVKNKTSIHNWDGLGSVIYDYLNLWKYMEQIDTLPQHQVEGVLEVVRSLSQRVDKLPTATLEQRVCQSFVADEVAKGLQKCLLVSNQEQIGELCSTVEGLPLTRDTSSAQYKSLVNHCLLSMNV
jgi:nuclear pore complex protein Nup98-Nup96